LPGLAADWGITLGEVYAGATEAYVVAAGDDAVLKVLVPNPTGKVGNDAGPGWKLVDPDGQLAEREADLGVLMREDLDELMAGDPYERARWLAQRTGTDAAAIWDWGLVERMSYGLSLVQNGKEKFGRISLEPADRIAVAG
jgi:hypothetical protein